MTGSDGEFPREHQRQRVLKAGRIVLDNRTSTIDVTLRDLSAGGAKLKLAQPMPLPDQFSLIIQNATTNHTETHHCEKRWQRADLVGVTFISEVAQPEPLAEAPEPPPPRYRLLKANSALFQDR